MGDTWGARPARSAGDDGGGILHARVSLPSLLFMCQVNDKNAP